MVTVYRFQFYDICSDAMQTSRRMRTAEAIRRLDGTVLQDQALKVDPSMVGSEIEGLTERRFRPVSST